MGELKYTEDHEWLRLEEDGILSIGITDYAQDQLGDIVYVELPEPGKPLHTGDDLVVIESVKTAGEIKAPVTGQVAKVNERLSEEPEVVNTDPLGDGWIVKLSIEDAAELESYMNEDAYNAFIETL